MTAREIPRKGGRTFGFRIEDGGGALAHLSDHCPTALGPGSEGLGVYHPAALALASGAALLLHDAQYTDEEMATKASFGHASCGYAVGLAAAARVGDLVLFHHDPFREDDALDHLLAGLGRAGAPVRAAVEGTTLEC